MQSKQVLN